jgi:ABC-type Fe3+-hydroxamate transport system substrate-binding protein
MTIFKLCTLFLILMLAGCGKTPEQTAIEKKIEDSAGEDTKVDLQKDEVAITGETEGGEYNVSSGEGAEIPKDFPTDVYIYHPSKVMTAMDMPKGGVLGLITTDDMSTVADTYKREMTARSWSEQSAVKNGERLMLVYEKEGRIANITIGSMDGAAQIMVTVTKK